MAVLATLVATAIAGGLRTLAVVLSGLQIAAVGAVVATTDAPGIALALPLVVLAAVVVGRRFDGRSCPVGALAAAAAVLTGGALALLAPDGAAVALGVAALAVPAAFLAIGWFDPRYAVAATVVWAWRLVAVDLGELADAAGALADDQAFRLFLARWLLMGAGVVLAGWVSAAAIRRSLSVFRSG
jgi:hypothetical protein